MNMFKSKDRKGEIKILRNEFNKLFRMSIDDINDFIEFDMENIILLEKTEKGTSAEAFVRIPKDILEKVLENEDDKIGFLLEIMLYTYGARHKHLRYTIEEFMDLFFVSDMSKREFVNQYCNKPFGNIIITHKRGLGLFVSFVEKEEVIVKPSQNKKEIKEVKEAEEKVVSEIINTNTIVEPVKTYKELKREYTNLDVIDERLAYLKQLFNTDNYPDYLDNEYRNLLLIKNKIESETDPDLILAF